MVRTLLHRILLISIPIFFVITLAAALSITNLLNIQEQVEHLGNDTVSQVQLSTAYDAQVQRLITEVTSYIYTGNPEEWEEAQEAKTRASAIIAELSPEMLHQQNGEAHAETEQLQQLRRDLLADIQGLLAEVEQQRESGASVNVLEMLEALEELEEDGEALSAAVDTHLQEDVVSSQQAAAASMQLALFSIVGVLAVSGVLILLSMIMLQRKISRPIREVSQAAVAVTQDDLTRRVTITSDDEVGILQHSFNQMVASLQAQRELLEQRNQELADERAALDQALADLQQSSAERTALLENTVEQLSAPILPVQRGVLVMPIIGAMGTQRAQRVTEALLEGVEEHQAHLVILDVTAVYTIDTQVAQAFVQAAQAVRLLGAQVMLTGIQPQTAQTLVQLGVDLGGIRTYSSLQAGIAASLR
jgi:anti-anti-sigma regulatory factor/HAMP domain-containing protein